MEDNFDKKELMNEVDELSKSKKNALRSITVDKFVTIISKEFSSIKKYDRVLRKLEKYIYSDEFIFSLDCKDVIKLLEVVSRCKHTSLTFLARLYEVSTKNDLLKSYFEDKREDRRHESYRQDSKIREIVNRIKENAKEVSLENKDNESSEND